MKRIGMNDGIASWKIDNGIERFLSRKADFSNNWKKLYVLFYKVFDSQYYKKGLHYIENALNIFVKKELSSHQKKEYILDMVYSLHRFGCAFDEYFLYHYPILNAYGRDSFITDKIRYGYYARMNNGMNNVLFDNKILTYKKYKDKYKREVIQIKGEQDKSVLEQFIRKHKNIIIKPLNDSCGRGIRIIDENDLSSIADRIEAGLICEERIIQSAILAKLHPQSINTVRMTTIRLKDKVMIFHPLLRVGVGESSIDNAAAGGIFALINEESGIVSTIAKDEKGRIYFAHPDTGVKFPGFQLPEWDEAISLVKELAERTNDYHYVAWDLAHTEKGWIIVEGNAKGQVVMMQEFFHTGFKNEIENILKMINE